MIRGLRLLYAALAAAFLAGIVVQVFLAGLGLFAGSDNFRTHVEVGWYLHLAPILILVVGALARAGRDALTWTAALALVTFATPLLPGLRQAVPEAAALHPVLAVVTFWLGLVVLGRAVAVARGPQPSADADTAAAVGSG